jgi:hypothetical protein
MMPGWDPGGCGADRQTGHEHKQDALFCGNGAGDFRIGSGHEIFIRGGQGFVPMGDQERFQVTE